MSTQQTQTKAVEETYKGYNITYQGISYACYALGIVGCTSIRQVRNQIDKKLKKGV